jgi:hypothetical protein
VANGAAANPGEGSVATGEGTVKKPAAVTPKTPAERS